VNYIVVYNQIVMSDGTVRQWRKKVKDWHAEEPSVLPSVVGDRHVQSPEQTLFEEQCITISEHSGEFPHESRTDFDEVISVRQGYDKMGSENANGCAQDAEYCFGLDFSER
jgi:hypothetical protein